MTKRSADGDLKKANDEEAELIVYTPNIVPPELKTKMNSLVEVLLPARHLVSDHKQVRGRRARAPDGRHGA